MQFAAVAVVKRNRITGRAAGFVAVDVCWKKLDSVIYGGQRSA